tara:strand:+ start:868 stop:1110 length:243 start_codon:yes stop_codon:yes gene_type:complete
MKLRTMKLSKKIFFDTGDNRIGHCSIYEKRNGNTYIVYYIEERYNTFQEFSPRMKLIDGAQKLEFTMINRKSYNADYFTS